MWEIHGESSEKFTPEGLYDPHLRCLMVGIGTAEVVVTRVSLQVPGAEPSGSETLHLWKWTGFTPSPCHPGPGRVLGKLFVWL